MIKSITYAAEEPGPRLLVLGAIHGNEKCGTVAINRVMGEIDAKQIQIMRGMVTFIPIANPRAYDEDRRYIERNLNRYLLPSKTPKSYEAKLGNVLCAHLEACDFLLDIHSYSVGGAPFISVEATDKHGISFAASLGGYTILTGWDEAYAATGRHASEEDKEESTGTTTYARRKGAVAAVTLECGQHKAPEGPEIAYQAIRNALRYLEMTSEAKNPVPAPDVPPVVVFSHVYYRDDEGRFPREWKNLERVIKGEIMAYHANGEPITAPDNGVIIMPKSDTPIGEEWFYFGLESAASAAT